MDTFNREKSVIRGETNTTFSRDHGWTIGEAISESMRPGKVYVTYNLSLNTDRTGGFVHGSGRGVVDADTVAAGFFKGIWRREGSTIVMHNVVNLADGSQNFDIITYDARRDTLKHEVYILR